MKTVKILSIGLAFAFALASCQQPLTPSGDATVGFSAAEYESGLGSQYIHVPIVTTGETTVYPITVNIAVGEYTGDYAAVEDVDFMITSKTIKVASPESAPSVEVKILNPSDADALYFKLVIESQDNAQSVSQSEVLVMCQKSDLDRICGTYNVTGTLEGAASAQTWVVSNVGGQAAISGIFGETGYILGDLNPDTMEVTFLLGPGTGNVIAAYNFTGIGAHFVAPSVGTYTSGGASFMSGVYELVGVVSSDYQSIEWQLNSGYGIGLKLFTYPDEAETSYFYKYPFLIDNNTITKVPR